MSERWFLVSPGSTIDCVGAVVGLEADEARHATAARRLRDGDEVTVFDGAGTVAQGRLTERGRAVAIASIERVPAPTRRIEIAAAIPKGDRVATMLDMATQLGMTAFIPLDARHSVVEGGEKAARRWRRVCVEACKQSRRAWLPMLREAMTPEEAVRDALDSGVVALLADQSGEPIDGTHREDHVRVFIGPEGGFDAAESEALRAAGAVAISLGDHVLRIETAVVASCAAFAASGPITGPITTP